MDDTNTVLDPRSFLKTISAQDFLGFGLLEMAYVKTDKDESGKKRFTVYRADGHSLVSLNEYDLAVATILHNDLEPVSLH